ncbi:MAG: hypothetical protein R3270_08990 [Gammaproteobacteria bacterium]|nr:hypothetical protein [Gammaproteobacteria bacterium]
MLKMLLTASAFLLALPFAPVQADDDVKEAVFSALERQIIAEYYREHDRDRDEEGNGKGKNKGKSKSLPPGIAKNLERGKPLPPGIQKTRLPNELQQKLPPAPEGHERVVVDGKVLLIDIATGIIRDKLEEAID